MFVYIDFFPSTFSIRQLFTTNIQWKIMNYVKISVRGNILSSPNVIYLPKVVCGLLFLHE